MHEDTAEEWSDRSIAHSDIPDEDCPAARIEEVLAFGVAVDDQRRPALRGWQGRVHSTCRQRKTHASSLALGYQPAAAVGQSNFTWTEAHLRVVRFANLLQTMPTAQRLMYKR